MKKGDTLWTLARKYGNEGRDIRHTVARIREVNQIGKKEHIYPGQSLFIPID
ncbi:MAG: LysM peptidoglycan-binding domain-containing protein [Bacillota bacterium]